MDRQELFTSIVAARPGRDEIVYLERRGDEYHWRLVPVGDAAACGRPRLTPPPTSGCRFSARWPVDDPERLRAFFDDVMAELESYGRQDGSLSLAHRRPVGRTSPTDWAGTVDLPNQPATTEPCSKRLQAAVGFRVTAKARPQVVPRGTHPESNLFANSIQWKALAIYYLPWERVDWQPKLQQIAGTQGAAAVALQKRGRDGQPRDSNDAAHRPLLYEWAANRRRLRAGQDRPTVVSRSCAIPVDPEQGLAHRGRHRGDLHLAAWTLMACATPPTEYWVGVPSDCPMDWSPVPESCSWTKN
jgi:hypothetical protein